MKRAGAYVQLHEVILASPAYRDLSPGARALLIEFLRIHRPSRNGRLSISILNAAKLLNVSVVVKMNDDLISRCNKF